MAALLGADLAVAPLAMWLVCHDVTPLDCLVWSDPQQRIPNQYRHARSLCGRPPYASPSRALEREAIPIEQEVVDTHRENSVVVVVGMRAVLGYDDLLK